MDQTPRRSNVGIALLAALLIAGSAAGVMLWQLSQKEAPVAADFGLDAVSPRPDGPAAAPAAARSGLEMIDLGAPPTGPALRAPSEAPAPPGQGAIGQVRQAGGSAESAFREAVRRSEARARDLAIQYTQRYPAIAQYGKDWMSRPDLKKLNDDYAADHDPVKFLRGLARAPSAPELAAKYAGDPAVRAFVKDALAGAPKELLGAASDMLVEDGLVRGLAADVGGALGLPKDFTDGLKDYDKKPAARPAQ